MLTTTANPAPKRSMKKKMNARNAEAQTEVRGDVEGTRRGGALTIVSACFVSMLPTVAAVAILAASRQLLPQTVSTLGPKLNRMDFVGPNDDDESEGSAGAPPDRGGSGGRRAGATGSAAHGHPVPNGASVVLCRWRTCATTQFCPNICLGTGGVSAEASVGSAGRAEGRISVALSDPGEPCALASHPPPSSTRLFQSLPIFHTPPFSLICLLQSPCLCPNPHTPSRMMGMLREPFTHPELRTPTNRVRVVSVSWLEMWSLIQTHSHFGR